MSDRAEALAAEVVRLLVARGCTLATAESLTGGGLGALLTSVPGASAAYVGGVICYATRVKRELLGVPQALVEDAGVVSAACAAAMATGVRDRLAADVTLATTGVAGPDQQEGKPVGLVYVACADRGGVVTRELRLPGDRAEVRGAAAAAALRLALDRFVAEPPVGS